MEPNIKELLEYIQKLQRNPNFEIPAKVKEKIFDAFIYDIKLSKMIEELKETDKTLDNFSIINNQISKKEVWKTPIPQKFFLTVGFLAFLSYIYFSISYFLLNNCLNNNFVKFFDFFLYGFWGIAPPMFFFWEYLRKFPYKLDSNQLADMKYTQELASKIWASLLITFGVILYSKYGVK